MPLYNTHCNNCEKDATRKLSYQEYELAKDGTIPCECGGTTKIVFDPSSVSFTLKDGESGGWVTKAGKENKYRAARYNLMGQRQANHVKPKDLVPNFGGAMANSWGEARDAARQSTYERVKREHGARQAERAAAASAKTFDAHVKRENKSGT